ncbi:MAG: phosphoglucosamine mutase [Planctomycetota bacterium]
MGTGVEAEAPLILGVSGLRGIVGESLTPEVAVRYVASIGAWLEAGRGAAEGEPLAVVVARDGRAGGSVFYHSAIGALLASGCDVIPLDVAMTPTVAFAVDEFGADAGVIVTASHNPAEWNGLKVVASGDGEGGPTSVELGACAPPATRAGALVESFRAGRTDWVAPTLAGSVSPVASDAIAAHAETVVRLASGVESSAAFDGLGNRRVVTDSVNASGGPACRVFAEIAGLELVQLGGDASGVFPHTPEPTAANLSGAGGLCDVVPGAGAAVGFAQDPDADRLAIVDERGAYIGEEYTPVLAAWSLLLERSSEGAGSPVICVNLSTSRMIDDVAAKFGAEVVRTAVGEANVVEAMKRLMSEGRDVVMGGEGNGGVIWPEVCFVRDSLSAMALTLSLMARTGKTVSELVGEIDAMASGGKGYAIVKRKVEIPSKDAAAPAVEAVSKAYADQKIDRQDGVRVDWNEAPILSGVGGGGAAWLHVRASNTEPIMRLIAEAGTEAQAGAILDAAAAAIGGGDGK